MAWIRSLLAFLVIAIPLFAQGGNPGDNRENMWPAPTAEDWKRPCLIKWQRTWKDALQVSSETGKPILICVNMDGEPASEHYAGIRYRQPEITALYEPYVCVIASVYRHNPRDYDDQGRRIPCPRFGTVTCGEHIAIEPLLYNKYFDGVRVAPRHIMIELDGQERYDVYYALDTDSVFRAIREGITTRDFVPPNIVRGDRSLVERVASRDVEDRLAVEKAFLHGDKGLKQSLLKAAIQHQNAAPIDLLRLAVFGYDIELSRVARGALTKTQAAGAVDLIAEALSLPMKEDERNDLITALERLGADSPHARTMAAVHRGLAEPSRAVKVKDWANSLGGGSYNAPDYNLEKTLSNLDRKDKLAGKNPDDPDSYVELAEAALAFAVNPETLQNLSNNQRIAAKYSKAVFEDVMRPARKAEAMGAKGWRVDRVIALASYYLGNREEAYARAEKAVAAMPPGDKSWNAMALISLFAAGRQEAITKAIRERKRWPRKWLTDVHAAYSVIARHPHCTDAQIVSHYDFLVSLRALRQARRTLEEGLARFPESWDLHTRLRNLMLWKDGADGLGRHYDELLEKGKPMPNLPWFAGYAWLVTAECHKRAGHTDKARAAYDRAIALYERNIAERPETRDTSDHFIALGLAGRARLSMEAERFEAALTDILASFKRKPEAAPKLDGLGFTPVTTAQTLLGKLEAMKRHDLAARLEKGLAELEAIDPMLLAPPPYEVPTPDAGPGGGRPRQGRRRGR